MLITIAEVIEIAYITLVDDKLVKREILETAVTSYIKPVLTKPFFDEVVANQASYLTLLNDYVKPCIAFYVKYLTYSQQLFETAKYSDPDPTKGKELFEQERGVLITPEIHQSIINDILFIARQKEQLLIEYLDEQNFELYEKPTTKRISGFLIQSTQ
jgi:hypothetical protein